MVRRIGRRGVAGIAAALVLAAVATAYWLFYDNRLPRDGAFPIDLAAIRAAAGPSKAGPARIEIEQLSHTFVPRIGVVAGGAWHKVDMVRASYRLVWPAHSVVVDTGYSLAAARLHGAARYDMAAWDRIQRALDRADAVLVTHEHDDHAGGLIQSPHLATLLPRLRLTAEQVARDAPTGPFSWPTWLHDRYRPIDYRGLFAVAPGVVLVKAPGHTPGSQMVYVRRADGCEFLFMGDIASLGEIVATEHIRPHYTTDIIGNDDRRAVMLEVEALHALAAQHPDVVLVPGHDGAAFEQFIRRGLLTRYFHL